MILCQKKIHKLLPTSKFSGYVICYIALIAVVLWSGCLGAFFRHLTRGQIDLRQYTDCKLLNFMFHFGRQYSSMLLVLMSLEKCFAVYFPLKSKTVCTVTTAKWVTGTLGVILAGYNSLHLLYWESLPSEIYGTVCLFLKGYLTKILYTVDTALYSFGPFSLMFITNFAIGLKFMTAKCKSSSTESTNQALVKSANRGTAMVVTVSVTFIVLTAPSAVDQALSHVITKSNLMYRAFMNITLYLNHSINGVLYIIVGSRFRNELQKILCRKNTPDDSHSVTNRILMTISRTRFWYLWNM